MSMKTVLNYIKKSALALTTAVALAGTANADVSGSTSTRAWSTPDNYGNQSTIRLDEPISLDAQLNYVPDSDFTSAIGSFDLGPVEIGGGYVNTDYEDWAAYVGVRPNGRISNGWGMLGGGVDFVIGAGGMSDFDYHQSVDWARDLPREIDFYTTYLRLYGETGWSPHNRLELNLRAYTESFAAISPRAVDRYPKALREVVRITDPRTTLALSDARIGAQVSLAWDIFRFENATVNIMYRAQGDLIIQDIGYMAYKYLDDNDDLPQIPVRRIHRGVLTIDIFSEDEDYLTLAFEGRFTERSTTSETFQDRNGWGAGVSISGRYGSVFGEVGAWVNVNDSRLEDYFGEMPNESIWAQLGVVIVDQDNMSMNIHAGAGYNTTTDALGLPLEGVMFYGGLAIEFGGGSSVDSNIYDPDRPRAYRNSARVSDFFANNEEGEDASIDDEQIASNDIPVREQTPIRGNGAVEYIPAPGVDTSEPIVQSGNAQIGDTQLNIPEITRDHVINLSDVVSRYDLTRAANYFNGPEHSTNDPGDVIGFFNEYPDIVEKVDEVIPGTADAFNQINEIIANNPNLADGFTLDEFLLMNGYRFDGLSLNALIPGHNGFTSIGVSLEDRRASDDAALERVDHNDARDFAILDRISSIEFGFYNNLRQTGLERMIIVSRDPREVIFQGSSARIRRMQRFSGRR